MIKTAKYNIGDIVKHEHQGYWAVIIDVDPIFQASGRYNPQASKRAFASRNPWYRLLVDNSQQITYVEECLLIKDSNRQRLNVQNSEHFLAEVMDNYRINSTWH